jgi:hypothetical protein
VHRSGDAPSIPESADLRVVGAQLDFGEHAAGPNPAGPDAVLAQGLDDGIGQAFAARYAHHQMPTRLACMNGGTHG